MEILTEFGFVNDIHHFHERAKSSQDAVADFPYFLLAITS
jgi:hypothetical protein